MAPFPWSWKILTPRAVSETELPYSVDETRTNTNKGQSCWSFVTCTSTINGNIKHPPMTRRLVETIWGDYRESIMVAKRPSSRSMHHDLYLHFACIGKALALLWAPTWTLFLHPPNIRRSGSKPNLWPGALLILPNFQLDNKKCIQVAGPNIKGDSQFISLSIFFQRIDVQIVKFKSRKKSKKTGLSYSCVRLVPRNGHWDQVCVCICNIKYTKDILNGNSYKTEESLWLGMGVHDQVHVWIRNSQETEVEFLLLIMWTRRSLNDWYQAEGPEV